MEGVLGDGLGFGGLGVWEHAERCADGVYAVAGWGDVAGAAIGCVDGNVVRQAFVHGGAPGGG